MSDPNIESLVATLTEKVDALEERVRELEVNQPTDSGYSIEDYGVLGDDPDPFRDY